MTQYYTPTINEFHIGFRYEYQRSLTTYDNEQNLVKIKEWVKEVASITTPNHTPQMLATMIEDNLIRVRHLNHYDIIEAGWKESTTSFSKGRLYYSLDNFECYLENKKLCIYLKNSDNENYCFKGIIKNYNQLLDVMDMLEI